MNRRIQLLDCTLRDGGLGLEDAYKNQIADVGFTNQNTHEIAKNLKDADIDIVELGSIEISEEDKTRFAIYPNVEAVSEQIPVKKNAQQMFVGLFRGPDTPVEDIPEWKPSFVDGLRVIIRYSELQKSLDFCAELARKGYKVFVQPMLTMRYTPDEIEHMIDAANDMQAYALYFVDSYGYMDNEDVLRLFRAYNAGLSKDIRIGFHAHNNMNLAYSNVKAFLSELSSERQVIVDACVTGMGQGAGNLQTELIVPYLNQEYDSGYSYDSVLDVAEILDAFQMQNIWGYSVTRLLPAIHKTAYKYAIAFRKRYGLTYSEINRILSSMPIELRHRYTIENAEAVLKMERIETK